MNLLGWLRRPGDRKRRIAELEVQILNEQVDAHDAEIHLRTSLRFAGEARDLFANMGDGMEDGIAELARDLNGSG